MTRVFAGRLAGPADAAKAQVAVTAGEQPVLLISVSTADLLSSASRELMRDLRTNGARTEFHVPGDADALLQSTNRLLADIPLESILGSTTRYPPHVLVIDEAESLSIAEVSALRRIATGLRGSAFRVLLLVRHAASGLRQLPLAELADLAVIWDLEGTTNPVGDPLPGSEFSASVSNAAPVIPAATGTRAKLVKPSDDDGISMAAMKAKDIPAKTDAKLHDVLAELAKERAEARGFDVTAPRRPLSASLKAVAALSILLTAGYLAYEFWLRDVQVGPLVYDCGLHADRDTVDVLLAQVGRTTPVRVIDEGGRFRLQVGPFKDRAATEAARAQVWRLGACRATPVAARSGTTKKDKAQAAKAGG